MPTDCLGDVLILGEVQQVRVAGVLWQVEATLGHCDLMQRLLTSATFEFFELLSDRRFVAAVVDVCEVEKDQAEDRGRILRGLEAGVRA